MSMKQTISKFYKQERAFFYVVPAFVWELLFFYVPLILMVFFSFVYADKERQLISLIHYLPFFSKTYFFIIFKSLILAAVNGILCFLIGYPLAYFLAYHAGRYKLFFLFLVILPFWTNFLLHVYSWFFVLDRGGIINTVLMGIGLIQQPLQLLNTLGSIIILMVYCYLPFMVLPIYSSLERIDQTLIAASRDLGATPFETWYHIVLPLSMSGVMTGFFLVFVPSFGEFAIPGLMGGEKFLFAGSVITQYALGTHTMAYGTAFTVMSLCILAFVLGAAYISQKLFYRLWMRL